MFSPVTPPEDVGSTHSVFGKLHPYSKGRNTLTRPIVSASVHEPWAGILSCTGDFLMGNNNIIDFPHILIRPY